MNNKVSEVLSSYQSQIERKERMIQRLQKKQFEDELTSNEFQKLNTLSAEINLLKTFIEDLQYIGEA